jgi:TATA-box binding protein (TBP) (component of TFIID and TFIIIB)
MMMNMLKIDDEPIYNNDNCEKIRKTILDRIKLDLLPKDVMISVITVSCKLNVNFNCENIAKYIDLEYKGITSVKYGLHDNMYTNRSLIKLVNNGKKKKPKNVFFNGVTMNVYIPEKKKKPVNVKLFTNGAIQMTGCKNIDNALDVIKKLLPRLRTVKAIIQNDIIVEKPFVNNINLLNFDNVTKFSINMLNSNFSIPFKIDRPKLYELLSIDKYDCFLDTNKHPCVRIRYPHPEKIVSIFVFEKGNIIITGGETCEQIKEAYNFIYKYLLTNYKKVVNNEIVIKKN